MRTALPAVTSPSFSDKPPHDDDDVRKRDPEVDYPTPPLRAPHEFLVGVMPRVRPLHDPAQTGSERGRLTLLGDHPDQLSFLQESASDVRLVAAVEVYAHRLGRQPQRFHSIEGGSQQWGVVTISRGLNDSKKDTVSVHHRRAFDAYLAAIHRTFARLFASTRSLSDAPIDGHIGQFEADEAIVVLKC
jgi:hypothetical protein